MLAKLRIPTRILVLPLVAALAFGCSDDDDDDGMGPDPIPPTANAGLAQESNPGNEVVLDGSGSAGEELSFHWRQISGVEVDLTDSMAVATTFIAPNEFGILSFELTVTDGNGESDRDGTLVYVLAEGNSRPTAEAGADQRVGLGVTVGLFGSGSDPDGDPLTFSWRQYAGTPADIALSPGNDAVRPTFIAPDAPTTLSFELTVDDGQGGIAMDSTTVVVEASPTPGVPFLWVLSVPGGGSQPKIGGWQAASLPLPGGDPVPPARLIEGGSTELILGVTDIEVDANGSILASIDPLSFEPARINSYQAVAGGSADLAPERSVRGPATLLSDPAAMALDRAGDVLYVVDEDGIFVFNDVSSEQFDGDVAPSRALLAGGTRYDAVAACLGPNGTLYIADQNVNGGSVWVYEDAATKDGLTAPDRRISVPETVGLTDVFVDDGNRMYVSIESSTANLNRIHVWNNASAAEADSRPDRSIYPNTGNIAPYSTFVDADDTGYVVDRRRNLIVRYDDIDTADGPITNTGSLRSDKLASPRVAIIFR